jgi:hypothetical protein
MFEYRVVFAPKTRKSFWRKDQSAERLSEVINALASENWEFQSSEQGMRGSKDMLVFRREIPELNDDNQKDVARALAPETFECPVVPRRPRPQRTSVPDYQPAMAGNPSSMGEVAFLRSPAE